MGAHYERPALEQPTWRITSSPDWWWVCCPGASTGCLCSLSGEWGLSVADAAAWAWTDTVEDVEGWRSCSAGVSTSIAVSPTSKLGLDGTVGRVEASGWFVPPSKKKKKETHVNANSSF